MKRFLMAKTIGVLVLNIFVTGCSIQGFGDFSKRR